MNAVEVNQKSGNLFYYKLLDFLNPTYNIANCYQSDLRGAAFAYFNSLILLDGIIDSSISSFKLFEATNGIEKSIRLLTSMFAKDHKFWNDFEHYKNHYHSTLKREKEQSKSKEFLSEQDFDKIAMGKSSVCYALVNAMSYLSEVKDQTRDKEITLLLNHLHIGFQCKDDIDDFIDDLENNQHTFAHALVFRKLESNNKIKENSHDFLHRYFYVSGLAERLILKSIKHFNKAQKIAERYHLTDLANFINSEISMGKAQIDEINLLIDKTRVKATLAQETLEHTENNPVSLKRSIQAAISFLNQSLEDNENLSDFMTSAGIGKGWITNYCAFILAGHELTNEITQKLSNSIKPKNNINTSFNENIVPDADSLTFKIGASFKIFNKTNNNQLSLLKEFQHANGGWCTYIDENSLRNQINLDQTISLSGWLNSHTCVSASTCYVLSLLPDQKDLYYKTASFLKKQLNKDGSLTSYWWSSPIYATAWLINAFSQDEILKPECAQSIKWLCDQQLQSGAWLDTFSNEESFFYTAMAVEALNNYDSEKYAQHIYLGLNYLLINQKVDGSWKSGRILTIPQTDIIDKERISTWRKSSFGVNIVVDDHKRIFTTATVLKTLISQLNIK